MTLRNAKWERFAINVFKNPQWSLAKSYEAAGYKSRNHSSEMAASRLMKNDEIRMRIEELSRPVARRAGLSLEYLIPKIEAAIADAKRDGAHGSVMSGHTLLLKIAELAEERNAGEAAQYGGATDAEGILDTIRDLIGDAPAAVVAAAITSDVYAKDVDKALQLIDEIKVGLIERVSAKAVLVS
ncbi:hypothetical protein [Bradyrhizobium sp. SZCCHNRI2010]|uniref:hypothetical protein n=1 Tax=Bradyrhizobium sp. SZCCHNRI2010 TaxID=3057283 RepID=UPI0028E507E2|nr:hypothetical protein [Bradyrhizobium sp. SZCCHNRI2010]